MQICEVVNLTDQRCVETNFNDRNAFADLSDSRQYHFVTSNKIAFTLPFDLF